MKKTIITGTLSLALGQSGVTAGEISRDSQTTSEKNKARVAQICQDPAIRAHMVHSDDICEVSEDGGTLWEAVGAAALAALAISGSTYMIRRRKPEEPVQTDLFTPDSFEKNAPDETSSPSDWEAIPGDIASLGIESASGEESSTEPWESTEYTNHIGVDMYILKMLSISESAHEYADYQLSSIVNEIHIRIEESKDRFCILLKMLIEKDGIATVSTSAKGFEKIELLMQQIGDINIPISVANDYYEIRHAEISLNGLIKEKQKQLDLLLEGIRNSHIPKELYGNIETLEQSLIKLRQITDDNDKNGAFSSKHRVIMPDGEIVPLDFDVGEKDVSNLDVEL